MIKLISVKYYVDKIRGSKTLRMFLRDSVDSSLYNMSFNNTFMPTHDIVNPVRETTMKFLRDKSQLKIEV